MDQTIGIGYAVDGVGQVVAENNKVIQSFENVVSKIGGMANSIAGFGKAMSGLSKSMLGVSNIGDFTKGFSSLKTSAKNTEAFSKALAGFPEKVSAAFNSLTQLTTAVQGYNVAMGQAKNLQLKPIAPQTQTGGDVVGTGKKAGTGPVGAGVVKEGGIPSVPGFMLRWRALSEGVKAVEYSFSDVLLGRSREKLAAGLGELSPLGFDSELKKQTEMSAKLFNQRFWTISAEKYVDAMSQTASAFNVQELGFENLRKMNESAIKLSAISKMSTEKGAELVSKTILAYLSQMPMEISEKLNKGLTADVKGYGKVDMGGLAEGMAAQVAKTVAVSSIWGPGIQSAFRGALPTLLERGWSMPASLAFVSAYADVGFQPGQGGKAGRDIFEREPENFAKTLVYGTGKWESESPRLDAQTLTHNKKVNKIRTEAALKIVQEYLGDEELAPKLFLAVGDIIKKAEAEGHSLKELGFSQYYLPMIRQTVKKPFQERIQTTKKAIEGASPGELDKQVEEKQNDAGTAYMRVASSLSNFFTTLSDTPWAHRLAGSTSKTVNRITASMLRQNEIARKNLTQDQVVALFLQHEDELVTSFGKEDADLVYNQMMRSAKGESGLSFLKQIPDTFYYGTMLGDQYADAARKSISDFWEENITKPIDSLGLTVDSCVTALAESVAYPFKRLDDLFQYIGATIESVLPKKPEITQEDAYARGIPGVEKPEIIPFGAIPMTPMNYFPPPQESSSPQVIQIDNKLHLDSRVITGVVAEIIQNNRDTYYHGYGGDPMGFVVT